MSSGSTHTISERGTVIPGGGDRQRLPVARVGRCRFEFNDDGVVGTLPLALSPHFTGADLAADLDIAVVVVPGGSRNLDDVPNDGNTAHPHPGYEHIMRAIVDYGGEQIGDRAKIGGVVFASFGTS